MPIDGPLMAIDGPHGTAMAIDELRWDLSTGGNFGHPLIKKKGFLSKQRVSGKLGILKKKVESIETLSLNENVSLSFLSTTPHTDSVPQTQFLATTPNEIHPLLSRSDCFW